MIDAIMTAIAWCNENSGFFSLLLAVIAICISIAAISSQNKIALFEKRLDIYFEALDIYSRASRLVELYGMRAKNLDTPKKLIQLKRGIAALILNVGGVAYNLAQKAMIEEEKLVVNKNSAIDLVANDEVNSEKELDRNEEKIKDKALGAFDEAVINYYEFCLEHEHTTIQDKMDIFFSTDVSDKTKRLIESYEEVKIGFVVFNAKELAQAMERIGKAVDNFQKGDVLKKIRKKFPV